MMMTRSQIRLSDICELVSEPVQPGARPESTYIGLEHLSPGRLTVSGSGRAVEMRSTTSAFQSGDVLYGKLRPYLDKAALADTLGVCTTELLVLRAKAGVDPRYLALVVHSPEFVDYAVAGTTGVQHPRTSWAHISQFRTPAFSIGEQRKIAPLIWLVHDTIGQTSRAIGEGEKLGRAAMRALFTRGLHREGQKETEIGMIPETWAFEQLGNIAAITYGAQAAVANATDPTIGIPILTNINLGLDGRINLEKKRYYRVPENQSDRLILRKGDLLFNWRSGSAKHVGKAAFFELDGEYTYSSFILRFRCHGTVQPKYLFQWLTYLRASGFFTAQRNVSSINSVYNASLAATIPIWFPAGEQQKEIVAVLDVIDRNIDLHLRKRSVLEELFKSLLHELMTGTMRVQDLDLSAFTEGPDTKPSPSSPEGVNGRRTK